MSPGNGQYCPTRQLGATGSAKRVQEETPAKAEKTKSVQEAPGKKLKFSFKEEREFATIDQDIAGLEAKIAENQVSQEQCGSDYIRLQELQAELTALENALEAKTERWLYLTELKEKIDAQK